MSRLDQNLSKLKSHAPDMAKAIESADSPEWLREDGKNLFIVQGDKIHKAYSDEYDSEKNREALKGKLLKGDMTVIVGVGDGRTLYDFLKTKDDKHHLMVIEPINYCLKLAMQKYDMRKWIKDGTLSLVDGEKGSIAQAFQMVESLLVVQSWFIMIDRYTLLRPTDYADCAVYAQDLVNQMQCNVGTVMGAGEMIASNDIANLPYVIRSRGVSDLKNIHKGKPAVIVSTGPSLAKNIHILQEKASKVVIIAVAQALRALLAYDIRPDFICTVDYGKVNLEHFDGLMVCGVPLIALNRSYAPILEKWQGPKFICVSPQPGFPGTAVDLMQQKGSMEQGGSVSHLCLGAAIYMGCTDIGIIGQDLAYEGDQSHIALADAGGKVKTKDGLIEWDVTDPSSTLKGEKSSMGEVRMVPGYMGGLVMTNIGLASFITSFENIIRKYPAVNFYNCTEGGAHIDGAVRTSLRNYIKRNGKGINRRQLKSLMNEDPNADQLVDAAKACLTEEVKSLDSIIQNATDGLRYCKQAMKKSVRRNPAKLKAILDKNEKSSKEAETKAKSSPLMGMYIYRASRIMHSREFDASGKSLHLSKNADNLKTRIKRNELILNAAKDAAEKLTKLYETARDALIDGVDAPEPEARKDISVAKEYLDVGNWAWPLVYFRDDARYYSHDVVKECVKIRENEIKDAKSAYDEREKRIEYVGLIDESQKVGRETQNFDESIKLIKKAIKLFPERFEARWGLATTYHHLGKVKLSAPLYEALVDDFPDNHRMKFELALVYFSFDESKGFAMIEKAMDATKEFDHYLAKLGGLYINRGNVNKAKECYTRYLESYPDNQEVKKALEEL